MIGIIITGKSLVWVKISWQAKDSYINKGWCGDIYLQATNLEFGHTKEYVRTRERTINE